MTDHAKVIPQGAGREDAGARPHEPRVWRWAQAGLEKAYRIAVGLSFLQLTLVIISLALAMALGLAVYVWDALYGMRGLPVVVVTAIVAFLTATPLTLFVVYVIRKAEDAGRALEIAQQAKDESLERLHLALGGARGGVWDRDLKTGRLHVSEPLMALIGFEAHEQGPKTTREWMERIHPDDLHTMRQETKQAIAGPVRDLHHAQYRALHKDGTYRWFQSRANVLAGPDGIPSRMIGVALDITDQVEAAQKVAHLMDHDAITGLPNQRSFLERLGVMLATRRSQEDRIVVARFDLDEFKIVNDRFGSQAGDDVMRSVAERLLRAMGRDGLVGHMAGDEFAIASACGGGPEGSRGVIERASAAFGEPFHVDGEVVELSVSVGAVVHPDDGATAEDLLNGAAIALGSARRAGPTSVSFLSQGMDQHFRRRATRAGQLRMATRREEMELHYQPIVSLDSYRTIGLEALVRWRHASEGLIPPDEFIGLAEDLGLIGDIGEWVLRRACMDASGWSAGRGRQPYVAVNVSPRQFDDPDFLVRVQQVLDSTGFDPERLELEITETALARDPAIAERRIRALRALGISIAIDDFGTGFSSLGALHQFPLSKLKIDKRFVKGYGEDNEGSVIADAILGLARTLEIPATAEGVETAWQVSVLNQKGAHSAQGYWFSRPATAEQAAQLVGRDWRSGVPVAVPDVRSGRR